MNVMKSILAVFWLFVIGCCWADPIDRPAEFWMEYDLIAEVEVSSLDPQKEIQHSSVGASQGFGHAATVEVRRALRSPADTNRWTIIVPTYWMDDGKRLPAFPFDEQLSNPGVFKIACKWNHDHAWLVLEELLPEELWARYEGQEKAGETNMPPKMSEGMKLIQDRRREMREAAGKLDDYRKRLEGGAISEEEYERLSNALLESVQKPITFSVE